MAQTFYLYEDTSLTSQFDPSGGDALTAESDGSSHDFVLYLGSTDTAKKLEAQSSPGVDQITATPADSASGSGHEAAEIKLALTSVGLDTATGGAALDLGTTINGGTANKVEIHVRITDATSGAASTELSITFNTLEETAI